MTDIGNSLREARIRKGLSIKDVADVTKIRSKYLEALEEDDFEVLPGPTYVKGFLRTYAAFLKLDADALVDEYRGSHEPRKEEPAGLRADVTQTSRSRTSTERKKKRVRRNQRGYALVGVVAVVVVVLLAWFGSGRGQDAASIDPSNISSPSSSAGITTVSSGAAVPSGNQSATSATSAGGNVALVVSVTEGSCWLVVREDSESGAEVYAGTLSAGGQETFASSQRYWMMVGRPEVLAVSVNGAS
ncbi:MAG: RodZ domain-containing protein, partial [bacterium]